MKNTPALMPRSITDEEMTPEKSLKIGQVIGRSYNTVCVGSDTGPSSMMIKNSLISGLLSAGADVNDAGIAPAPAVAFASKGSDCAVMVGEPDEESVISRIYIMNPDGSIFTREQQRQMILAGKADKALPGYKDIGELRRRESVIDIYNRTISAKYKKRIDAPVMLDCGCGCTSVCAPQILASVGADLTTINAQNDLQYNPRPPGVGVNDVSGLGRMIDTESGSIGIALNRDGTKLALFDECGKFVEPEKMLALMLIYLKPSSLVVPFSASAVVDDAFRNLIGKEIVTDANASNIRRIIRANNDLESITAAVKEHGAEMGAMADGTFIFPEITMCPDAMNAAVILAEMSGNNNISNLLSSFPSYFVIKDTIYGPGNTELFNRKLGERLKELDAKDVWEIEGGRVGMSEGWFAISRNRDNSEYIDVAVEAKDKAYAVSMMELAKGIVRDCIVSEY